MLPALSDRPPRTISAKCQARSGGAVLPRGNSSRRARSAASLVNTPFRSMRRMMASRRSRAAAGRVSGR